MYVVWLGDRAAPLESERDCCVHLNSLGDMYFLVAAPAGRSTVVKSGEV